MSFKKIIIGLLLSMLLGSGVAVAADYDKAFKAAQSGDFKTALAEWTPLAEQGDAKSQHNLGIMYEKGEGVPKNYKTAVKWYTLAAEQGDSNAQFNLGVMYENGTGVPENDKTALKWFTKSATQGQVDAQLKLGIIYQYALGAPMDKALAYMWYNIAAYNDSKQARKNKEALAKFMKPKVLSKAQDMSNRCLESNYTDC